jgi:hypothetical protein
MSILLDVELGVIARDKPVTSWYALFAETENVSVFVVLTTCITCPGA